MRTSILEGDVGEPPDVAEADREAQRGEEELDVVAPRFTLLRHNQLQFDRLLKTKVSC